MAVGSFGVPVCGSSETTVPVEDVTTAWLATVHAEPAPVASRVTAKVTVWIVPRSTVTELVPARYAPGSPSVGSVSAAPSSVMLPAT